MHARILKYLHEVARAGSIRRAAEKLNVSASTITRQILALEADLGTPVFERLPKKLRLTAAGEILISHVRTTLKDHERTRSRILDLKGLRSGKVTIATLNSLAGGIVSKLAYEFGVRHPRVQIVVRSMVVDQILRQIDEGEADIGLTYNLPADIGVYVVDEFRMPMGAVVGRDHPLAKHVKGVRASQCADYPIVLADESMTAHKLVVGAFRRANRALVPRYSTNSIEMMKNVVRRGQAITFLSPPAISEEPKSGGLVFLPLLDPVMRHQRLSLFHRANASMDLAPGLFTEELRNELHEMSSQN